MSDFAEHQRNPQAGDQRPLHMRAGVVEDEVARIGDKGYSSLVAAIKEGQGEYIDVLRDCEITEPIEIYTAGTTLDLGGHTVVFLSPDPKACISTDDLPAITVSAPGITFYNGRIAVLSGAPYAIRIRKLTNWAELALLNVGIAYEGVGYAITILEGIVILQEGRIDSEGSGIHLASQESHMGVVRSRIIASEFAASVCGGRLILDCSELASRNSHGIFAEDGLVGVYTSVVGSYRASAIYTRARLKNGTYPKVRICEYSEITSVKQQGLLLNGGNATVLRSLVRSFEEVAIELGSHKSFVPTSLSVVEGSTISSWRRDGIVHRSGELYVNHSRIDARDEAIRKEVSTKTSKA